MHNNASQSKTVLHNFDVINYAITKKWTKTEQRTLSW